MGIGGALAEARSEAGLTVTQVSERTRIRETIIRDIEHDDYAACGGDYYARGHIRAIAHVVGADPVPLIEEYDAEHLPPPELQIDLEPREPSGWHLPGLHWLAGSGANGHGNGDGVNQNGNDVVSDPAARNGHGRPGPAPPPGPAEADDNADTDPDLFSSDLLDQGTLQFSRDIAGSAGSRDGVADRASRAAASGLAASRAAVSDALDAAARWAETAKTRLARPAEPAGSGVPGGITAAEAFRPAMPLQPRRSSRALVLAVLVLAAIGLLIYFLVSGGSSPAPARHPGTTHHNAGHAAAAQASSSMAPAQPSASNSAAASQGTPASLAVLSPVSAVAFGPAGTAHGDDPARAALAIDSSARTGWHSDWYTTARFGGLQPGTGLLLNMGKAVRVSATQLALGPAAGGTVQLRAGNAPALADLPVVAQAANPGGTLTMHVSSPVSAQYLLIWFTSLPPDSSGTYQANVDDIKVTGTV